MHYELSESDQNIKTVIMNQMMLLLTETQTALKLEGIESTIETSGANLVLSDEVSLRWGKYSNQYLSLVLGTHKVDDYSSSPRRPDGTMRIIYSMANYDRKNRLASKGLKSSWLVSLVKSLIEDDRKHDEECAKKTTFEDGAKALESKMRTRYGMQQQTGYVRFDRETPRTVKVTFTGVQENQLELLMNVAGAAGIKFT